MRKKILIFIFVPLAVLGISTTTLKDNNKFFEIAKNIEIFANLYKEVNTYYVDEIEPAELMRIGVDAMVNSLDPYTNYISEAQIEGYRFITEGRYNGIGASSQQMGDYLTITELYKDQPADKAGLKVGDQILEVDDKDAKNKSAEDINNILRGFPGTEVTLKINRPGEVAPLTIKLVREEVDVENVPYYGFVSDGIGYVALRTFTREAGNNVADALRDLQADNPDMKGVIFDLRGNGGGLLTEAVNVSNVFVDKNELVVTTKGKVKEWDRSFKTLNQPVDTEIPLVVLINNRSASASEIVSGVIQDYDRGVLLGQRSYGKGLVQNTRDIGYNAKVKMTTAKYYIPSGRCIQAVSYKDGEPIDIPESDRTRFETRNGRTVLDGGGVKPDIVVDRDGNSDILKQLDKSNLIFDFVTDYCKDKENVDAVADLHFSDFDQFLAFAESKKFSFDTETEDLLEQIEKESQKEGYEISESLEAVKQSILDKKRKEVLANKDAIVDLIEKEIAGRYYYRKGKIQIGLRNDLEIQEAISLLSDEEKYEAVLK